jgi:tRNA 2-thiouridine synthesizing protein C
VSVESKSLLLIFRRAPYGRSLARAGYDFALAAAAFEQPVSLLFMDDGVWQLLPDQAPAAIAAKNVASTLDSLALYDIESLYADTQSLATRGLAACELRAGVELIPAAALGGFIDGFDTIVSF